MFQSLGSFDEQGFAYAQLNDKWGFINRQGNWVIQPMFQSLGSSFDEKGFARAQLNDKWGLINRQGNWVVQPMFDSIEKFDEQGLCEATIGDKYGFINRSGHWIIQPIFDIQEDEWSSWFDDSESVGVYNEENILQLIEECFRPLDKSNKVYIGNDIPNKKLNAFRKNYNSEFIAHCEPYVYWDSTVFGGGDNGFLFVRFGNEYWFLLIKEFLEDTYALGFIDNSINDFIVSIDTQKNGFQLLISGPDHEPKWISLPVVQGDVKAALIKFLSNLVEKHNLKV